MNVAILIFKQFHVCQLLFESGASQTDLANLTTCSKAFADARRGLLYDIFTLKFYNLDNYKFAIAKGTRRVKVYGAWTGEYQFDFAKKEKRLLVFICFALYQPVHSFGNLIHFECHDSMHQSIESFDSLRHFHCGNFNQPIASFGLLKHFKSFQFNQPIKSFESLTHFECWNFNQPINSFGALTTFRCVSFNQPIESFGLLEHFAAFNFTQKMPKVGPPLLFLHTRHFPFKKF